VTTTRYHRLVDNSPGPNISGRDEVRGAGMTTRTTFESISSGAVSFFGVTARGTLLACVGGVHQNNGGAYLKRLVLDERSKLKKSPVSQPIALFAPSRYPLADTLKIFKGDTATGAFSIQHDGFGDAVVDVFLVPSLFTRYLTEFSRGGSSLFPLKVTAAVRELSSVIFNRFAAVGYVITVGSQVDNSKIDTDKVVGVDGGSFLNVAGTSQKPLTAAVNQIGLALAILQQFTLVVAASPTNLFAAFSRPNRKKIVADKPQDFVVVRLRRCRFENSLRFLASDLVGVGDFCDASYRQVRYDAECFTRVFVSKVVKVKLSKRFFFNRACRKVVTHVVGGFQRCAQNFRLSGSRKKFDLSYQFHLGYVNIGL